MSIPKYQLNIFKYLLISFLTCFGIFGVAGSSWAVYPVAGRKRLSLLGFIFTIFILFTGIFTSSPAYGATINAATCEQADVQAAINSASDGDTVLVPAGSCADLTSKTQRSTI